MSEAGAPLMSLSPRRKMLLTSLRLAGSALKRPARRAGCMDAIDVARRRGVALERDRRRRDEPEFSGASQFLRCSKSRRLTPAREREMRTDADTEADWTCSATNSVLGGITAKRNRDD